MGGVIARAVFWVGQMALGWLGSDWWNERSTTKQVEALSGANTSEVEIIKNTAFKNWAKWAAGAAGLLIGFILFNKFIEKKK